MAEEPPAKRHSPEPHRAGAEPMGQASVNFPMDDLRQYQTLELVHEPAAMVTDPVPAPAEQVPEQAPEEPVNFPSEDIRLYHTPINLTPHAISVKDETGTSTVFEFPAPEAGGHLRASGNVRVADRFVLHIGVTVTEDVPVKLTESDIELLRRYRGKSVIVSRIAAEAAYNVNEVFGIHFYGSDTSPTSAIRDGDGRIVGVKRLLYLGYH